MCKRRKSVHFTVFNYSSGQRGAWEAFLPMFDPELTVVSVWRLARSSCGWVSSGFSGFFTQAGRGVGDATLKPRCECVRTSVPYRASSHIVYLDPLE